MADQNLSATPPVTTQEILPPEEIPNISQPGGALALHSALGFDVDQGPIIPNQQSTVPEAEEYGFDDETVRRFDFEFYKGHKDVTDRIGFLSLPFGGRVHFKNNLGYFTCLSKFKKVASGGKEIEVPERLAECCKVCDPSRKRFIAPIIKYTSSPDGKVDFGRFSYTLLAWRYTEDKYVQMKTLHREFPIDKHDLMITCTEEGWQRMNIQACRESIWIRLAQIAPQEHKTILDWTASMRPKMAKTIGKRWTEKEMLEKLGLIQSTAVAAVQMDTPMMDIADLLKDPPPQS